MSGRWQTNIGRTLALLIVVVIGVAVWSPRPDGAGAARSAAPSAAAAPARGGDPESWSGVEWRVIADPFLKGDPEPLRIDGLVDLSGLLIGWGRVAAVGQNQFNDMGAVFVSQDGVRWRSIALDDGVPAGDTSEPYGVAAGPLGFIIWGGVCCGIEEAATWGSADGISWSRLRGDRPRAGFVDVAASPAGWVGVGADGNQTAIWSSGDGRAWQAIDLAPRDRGKGIVSDVSDFAGRLVAVGTLDDAADTHDGAVWTSNDGRSWSRLGAGDPTLTGPDETELARVIPFDAGLFVIGNHGSHDERVKCEKLIGTTASLVAVAPETALSCGWGREHHWLSEDGTAWQRLAPFDPLPGQQPDPAPHPVEFRNVVAVGRGLVDPGEDNVRPDGDTSLWVSMDGRAWRRLDAIGERPPAGSPAGTAIRGNTIVVVGEADEPGRGIAVRIGMLR